MSQLRRRTNRDIASDLLRVGPGYFHTRQVAMHSLPELMFREIMRMNSWWQTAASEGNLMLSRARIESWYAFITANRPKVVQYKSS